MHKIVCFFWFYFRVFLTLISPRLNTEIIYLLKFKRRINLNSPKTLDEKIQWLKFHTYYKNDLVRNCVDKYKVREYVCSCGCPEILNDLYGVYDTVDEVPWDELPNQFVLKWNFGCGQNLICFDKSKLSIDDAKKKLKRWYKIHKFFYLPNSEMQYKGIIPKLVCERLITSEEEGMPPVDYKLYCFNGKADCVLVCTNRKSGHPDYYFFDRDWNLKRYNKKGMEASEDFSLPKPNNIDKLFDYAGKLTKPFPFVRADFYIEKDRVIFGELTFTPCGGFDRNRLYETQLFFGSKVEL